MGQFQKGMKRPTNAGRRAGTPNKKNAEKQEEMKALGELPLDYLVRIFNDPSVEPARRDAAARAACPFLHPTLSAVAVKHLNPDGSAIEPMIVNQFNTLPDRKDEPVVMLEPPSESRH